MAQIRKNITFGSYQIKQSVNYVADHLNQDGQFEILIDNQIECETDGNIILAEVKSRHSSNTEYSVMIKYIPNIDCATSIKAWGCTCHSGLRTVGCCSHIASIIYFLSYAKYLDEIAIPGKRLINSIITNEVENDDFCGDMCSDTQKSLKVKSQESFESSSTKKRHDLKELIAKNASQVKNEIAFKTFTKHIPELGGRIIMNEDDFLNNHELYKKCSKFDKLEIINSCSIDYFLFAFWCSSKLSSNFSDVLKENAETNYLNKTLVKIVSLIDNLEWNRVKSLWLLIVCRLSPNENLKFCTFNTEHQSIVQYFYEYQRYQFCCLSCAKDIGPNSTQILLYKTLTDVFINTGFIDICEECFSFPKAKFLKKPYCLFIETFAEENVETITIEDVPLSITMDDRVFHFLCGTMWNFDHFTSIFRLNGSYYLIDDTKKMADKKIPKNSEIKTLFYYYS